jgi:protoporphyrinogen oxidase
MYAEPARAFIEDRGGEVRTDSLARIILGDRGPAAVEVRTRPGDGSSGGMQRIVAHRVIAAVPWHALRNLFPHPPASLEPTIAAATAMESMPIVTVNLWYDRVVMNDRFIGLSGRTVQWIFDKRAVFGEASSHLSLVVSAAESLAPLSRDELVAIAAREVAEALPAAADARLVRATVVREKQATFSLSAGQPVRPPNRTSVPGLVLAGDWTNTGLPGTIESAVVSGHGAAEAVLTVDG